MLKGRELAPMPPRDNRGSMIVFQAIFDNQILHLQSTKETTFPVLPPTFLRAEAAFEAALDSMGPAVEVARERPWEALEAAEEAASAPLEACSEVLEAYLTADLRVKNCDCRSTARDAVTGMVKGGGRRRLV